MFFARCTKIAYRCSSRIVIPIIKSLLVEDIADRNGKEFQQMLQRSMKELKEEKEWIIMAKAPREIY